MSRIPTMLESDGPFQSVYNSDVAWAGKLELAADNTVERHKHDFWEFLYIVSGKGQVCVGTKNYTAQSGDLFIYPPSVEHDETPSQGETLVVRVLSIINTGDITFMEYWPLSDPHYVKFSQTWLNIVFDRISDKILSELEQMDTAYTIRIKALSFEWQSYLMMYVEKTCKKGLDSPQENYVFHTQQYILQNYQRSISLESIASNSYVSTYYLSHIFKKITGSTPMNYLTTLRMKKAQDLLENTRISISEVGRMVGYEDVQHFSNSFKKHFGCSPRVYRQSRNQSTSEELEE